MVIKAFEYIDKDRDGVISLDDLKQTNQSTRLGLSEAELSGLIEEADKNGDGRISMEEFVAVMKKTNLFK